MQRSFLTSVLEPFGRLGALLCGWACLGLSALICFEVVARKLFNFSVQGADEIGGYVLAVTGAFGFSYALIHKTHTRIDLFLSRVAPPVQALLNLLALITTSAFALFVAWRAWATLSESLEFGSVASTPLQTPLWIPQTVWFAGLCLFAGVAAAYAVHAMVLMIRAPQRLYREYGPQALGSEIAEWREEPAGGEDPPGSGL